MQTQAKKRGLNWNSVGLGSCLNSVTKQPPALGKPSNFSAILFPHLGHGGLAK